jgi:hypothetical protein
VKHKNKKKNLWRMIIMISLEELLLKLVSELRMSEFYNACERAGLDENDVKFILDVIHSRGE